MQTTRLIRLKRTCTKLFILNNLIYKLREGMTDWYIIRYIIYTIYTIYIIKT